MDSLHQQNNGWLSNSIFWLGSLDGAAFQAVENCEVRTMLAQHRIRAVIWDLDGVILRRSGGTGLPFQADSRMPLQHPAVDDRQVDHSLLGFISAMRPSVQTALLVNSWAEVWEIVHHKDALTPAFDRVIQAVDAGLRKADPRVFSMVAIRMGISPREAVLVDADSHHVAAARQAGLHAYAFENPAQIGSQLMDLLMEPVN